MKIGLHFNQLDYRGSSTIAYDYAKALREVLGHEVTVISSNKSVYNKDAFVGFNAVLYDSTSELSRISENEKLDVLYMAKAGNDDKITPTNVKTAIHCVFDMREPHGSVYAGISEWLATFFKKDLWVPHIISMPKTNKTMHSELGIPKDAFVVGRIGGFDQFDVIEAHKGVISAVSQRQDLWFVFVNTRPFISHERVKFLPPILDLNKKAEYINTCDAMVHGRSDGETFGLAVGEFSAMNKPVLTFDSPNWWYMRAHIHMLDDRAILYKNADELAQYLLQIDKSYVAGIDWDRYSIKFSPENVIKKFDEVFLK